MAEIIEEEEEDSGNPVVSERVQVLAQGIYEEFQSMVESYGPECISNLMPLVVNVLENLDSSVADNQDHLKALMEVNEENQQLSKQFEREKQRRREIEEKAMRLEDMSEQDMRQLKDQMSKLSVENKNLSVKLHSQKDQMERLEDRHENMKKEKKGLHDRNIELIKNFHGQMESMSAAIKIAETRRSAELAESPGVKRAPGFQDFTSPQNARKKRQLPIAPRRRGRATSDADDEFLLGTTPAPHPDSPEYSTKEGRSNSPPNVLSLHDEPSARSGEEGRAEEQEGAEYYEEDELDPFLRQISEEFVPNDESLLAELHAATSGSNVPGVDQIIMENEELTMAKTELTSKVDELTTKLMFMEHEKQSAESMVATMQAEQTTLSKRISELEGDKKKLWRELEEEKEKAATVAGEASEKAVGLTRLEVARILRERNEYKEKYLSLLEQIRMNDELYLFKRKEKKSRWFDFFAAVFSPAKRRQMAQDFSENTPRRPILGAQHSPEEEDEEEGSYPSPGVAGYQKTKIIPTLRKMGKRQDEVYMTSVSWVIPALDQQQHDGSVSPVSVPPTPNINTCRPMSYQEEGAKIMCAAAINPAIFLQDHTKAVTVQKEVSPDSSPHSGNDESSMSLVWIVTGIPNLTKVSILDAAAVGEVLETFPVSSTPVQCIASIPEFDDHDPDVLASLSTARRKPTPAEVQSALGDRPSSKHTTMWMGSDSGILYVHSAVSQWKKCIHADKLPAAIQSIVHLKGKVFLLLQNASLAVFRRFPDGEWDWDNYSLVVLSQRKDLPATSMSAVKFNVWCAIGNTIYVVHSHMLKMEATFPVHPKKRAEVNGMVTVGDGVWISFKFDSTLRLFSATTFTHMQDLDIAPSVHKILVFGSERRSSYMCIQISTIVAAHNSLWVGTENGVLLIFPFNTPTSVAEETGWEVAKEAVVQGQTIPEPFDVRTEHAVEAGSLISENTEIYSPECSTNSRSPEGYTHSESPLPSREKLHMQPPISKPFHPFCTVDQVQLSIHCHINAVRGLVCVPGLVPKDLAIYEPLGGVFIGSGDEAQRKPALFVMSCGEGHLDLRTADKVLQTLHAKETGQSGLPSAASIISEKNYVMVWDIAA